MPSARFRVRQYRPVLRAAGVELDEAPARFSSYPPIARSRRLAWGIASLAERSVRAAASWRYDVTLLQREMISTMVTAESLTRRPRLLDVDDAIWLTGGVPFARRLARLADHIVCGNAYLAEQFARWNPSVSILATAVDTTRFQPDRGRRRSGLIGWSGSSSGFAYLYGIMPALRAVLAKHAHARLRVVADAAPDMTLLPPGRMEFVAWSPAEEVRAIQEMDVGLMPLPDNDWERGKCSYKMLLYAACGVPSVVSPVGMNNEVLAQAPLGAAARSSDEWVGALDWLLGSEADALRAGSAGRELMERCYAVDVIGPALAAEIRALAGSVTPRAGVSVLRS